MFILLLNYKKTIDEVMQNIEAHRAYLDPHQICPGAEKYFL